MIINKKLFQTNTNQVASFICFSTLSCQIVLPEHEQICFLFASMVAALAITPALNITSRFPTELSDCLTATLLPIISTTSQLGMVFLIEIDDVGGLFDAEVFALSISMIGSPIKLNDVPARLPYSWIAMERLVREAVPSMEPSKKQKLFDN